MLWLANNRSTGTRANRQAQVSAAARSIYCSGVETHFQRLRWSARRLHVGRAIMAYTNSAVEPLDRAPCFAGNVRITVVHAPPPWRPAMTFLVRLENSKPRAGKRFSTSSSSPRRSTRHSVRLCGGIVAANTATDHSGRKIAAVGT